MTPEDQTYSLLSTDAAVVDLVGDNIFAQIALEDTPTPYVTYRRVNIDTEYTLSGSIAWEYVDVRLDLYADTYEILTLLSEAVEGAMEDIELFDEDTSKDEFHKWIIYRFLVLPE